MKRATSMRLRRRVARLESQLSVERDKVGAAWMAVSMARGWILASVGTNKQEMLSKLESQIPFSLR